MNDNIVTKYKVKNSKVIAVSKNKITKKVVQLCVLYFKCNNLPYIPFLPYKLLLKQKTVINSFNKEYKNTFAVTIFYLYKNEHKKGFFHKYLFFPESYHIFNNSQEIFKTNKFCVSGRYDIAEHTIHKISEVLQRMYILFYNKQNIKFGDVRTDFNYCIPAAKQAIPLFKHVYDRHGSLKFIILNIAKDKPLKDLFVNKLTNAKIAFPIINDYYIDLNVPYRPYFCNRRLKKLFAYK